ncbi:MAG: DUF3865 domain-containing protein [Candidatus Aenigmarchaeota archaeon]|nr:DUF3865 domain-containing protein [Candidatus Aenigmarchaeota archaeon]
MSGYAGTVERLDKSMMDDYISMDKNRNPVFLNRTASSNNQLAYAVGQYAAALPRNIVSFLYSARDTARRSGWQYVDTELTRNMGEELGTETRGLTHYMILAKGIEEGIGLDVLGVQPSGNTLHFVHEMEDITTNDDAPYVAGGAFALESTAVSELEIVSGLLNELFMRLKGSQIPEGILRDFMHMHIHDWEPGHVAGLKGSCGKYIQLPAQCENFEAGFRDVMRTMDKWWIGLYEESRAIS